MNSYQGIKARVSVLHEIPGRLRLRYPRAADPALDQQYLRAILLAVPGVKDARINARAASIVLQYDGKDQTRQECLEMLGRIPREGLSPRTQGAGGGGAFHPDLLGGLYLAFTNLALAGQGRPELADSRAHLARRRANPDQPGSQGGDSRCHGGGVQPHQAGLFHLQRHCHPPGLWPLFGAGQRL